MTNKSHRSAGAMAPRLFIAAGSLCNLAAVMLGALGAHALNELLAVHDGSENFARVQLYLFVHGLALIGVGLHSLITSRRSLVWAGAALLIGCVLFQGSLLVLSLTGWRPIRYVTPFGGVSLMLGWLVWAITAGLPAGRQTV